jgi:hypothetical protein
MVESLICPSPYGRWSRGQVDRTLRRILTSITPMHSSHVPIYQWYGTPLHITRTYAYYLPTIQIAGAPRPHITGNGGQKRYCMNEYGYVHFYAIQLAHASHHSAAHTQLLLYSSYAHTHAAGYGMLLLRHITEHRISREARQDRCMYVLICLPVYERISIVLPSLSNSCTRCFNIKIPK